MEFTVSIKEFMKITTICIPDIHNNLSKTYITNVLNKLEIGTIKSIVERRTKNENNYKCVILRVIIDSNTSGGNIVLDNFQKGKTVKIVHKKNDTFWKLINAY